MAGKDFVHECNSGQNVFDQEDKVIISTTVDEFDNPTKSTGKLSGDITKQGASSSLWGRRGWVEGDSVEDYTSRGNNADITRQRKHYEYIDNIHALSKR
jgi:hypothetical protein